MELQLLRYSDNQESTLGIMLADSKFECYTLEDEFRNVKVAGETRIPEGEYEIKFREVMSPMTEKYRQLYPWFEWHIEIVGVPGFQFVYIHVGNTAEDSDACVLVGDSTENNKFGKGRQGYSVRAFERFYKKVWRELKSNKKVKIKITDLEK